MVFTHPVIVLWYLITGHCYPLFRCNSKNIHLNCLHLGIVWLRFVHAKTYPLHGTIGVNKSQQTILGVQFGCNFCGETVVGIFVRRGICLPVTPDLEMTVGFITKVDACEVTF